MFIEHPDAALFLRAALMCLSFFGLSAGLRRALRMDRFTAPFAASCLAVAVLMIAGMLGALDAAFWLLFAAGLAGAAWVWIARGDRLDPLLIALFFVWLAYLAWRFWPCPLLHTDDLSHWGLVARLLQEQRRFPGAADAVVMFQSYPLGAACWCYYVGRIVGVHEGLWVMAQYLWIGIAFLPMLAFVRKNRPWLWAFAAAAFLYLVKRNPTPVGLQVDWLLAALGLGGVASVLANGDRPRAALASALTAAVATALVKNSGMFFALGDALALLPALGNLPKRRRIGAAALCAAAFVGAYLLWVLHVRIAFPAGLASKHAVSLSAYASELSDKGGSLAWSIVKSMAAALVRPTALSVSAVLVFLGCAGLIAMGARLSERPLPAGLALRGLLWGLLAYGAWYVLLTLMYIFSMPEDEARELASYSRYTSAALSYAMGLAVMQVLRFFGAPEAAFGRRGRAFFACVGAMALAALIAVFPYSNFRERLFVRVTEPDAQRERILRADELSVLPAGARLLVYCDNVNNGAAGIYYEVKYQFMTADIVTIVDCRTWPPEPDAEPGWVRVTHAEGANTHDDFQVEYVEDPLAAGREALDEVDAVLMLTDLPDIAEALSQEASDLPVILT